MKASTPLLLIYLACSDGLAAVPGRVLESQLEREFGAVMGSVLHQNIVLEADPGATLEENLLPAAGSAISDWLEVRGSAWRLEQRSGHTRFLIDIHYQVFKGVRQTEILTIPPVSLSLKQNGAVSLVEAAPIAFSLSPLIPPATPDEEMALRPLHSPPALVAGGHAARLALWFAGLATLLVYAAWRLGLPPFARIDSNPFAEAARELRALRRAPATAETTRQAFRALHRALDRFAGRTVLENHLPGLIEAHPELAQVRAELEALFAHSHRLFFVPDIKIDEAFPLARLEQICRHCRRLAARRA